jgi:hypothetical protein
VKLRLAVVALLVACSCGAVAQGSYFVTTDVLAEKCRTSIRASDNPATLTAKDWGDASFCLGYVEGALDSFESARGWNWSPKNESVCVPASVKGDQAIRVFVKYADNHPEELNKAAPAALWAAMHNAFPCAQ